jgi:hypothetical protein
LDDRGKRALSDDEQRPGYGGDFIGLWLQCCEFLSESLNAGDLLRWGEHSKCRDCASRSCDEDIAERHHFEDDKHERVFEGSIADCVVSLGDED